MPVESQGDYLAELDEPSRTRVAALLLARMTLRGSGLSAPAVDPLDLVAVARFILSGRDPWAQTDNEQ